MLDKEVYCRPEVLSFEEEDLKEWMGVAETQYFTHMVQNNCLDAVAVSNSVQDEYTFHAFAGTVIDVSVDVPDRAMCPGASTDCPLNPEIAICRGIVSPTLTNPDCFIVQDGTPCTDASLNTPVDACASITGFTASATDFYTIGVSSQGTYPDPSTTGCYVLTVDSSADMSNWQQRIDDGADTFLRRR
jgi:hypothetical protein